MKNAEQKFRLFTVALLVRHTEIEFRIDYGIILFSEYVVIWRREHNIKSLLSHSRSLFQHVKNEKYQTLAVDISCLQRKRVLIRLI